MKRCLAPRCSRWHSSPTGATRDLYLALDAALTAGHSAQLIRDAANSERGVFLYNLFRMAYAGGAKNTP